MLILRDYWQKFWCINTSDVTEHKNWNSLPKRNLGRYGITRSLERKRSLEAPIKVNVLSHCRILRGQLYGSHLWGASYRFLHTLYLVLALALFVRYGWCHFRRGDRNLEKTKWLTGDHTAGISEFWTQVSLTQKPVFPPLGSMASQLQPAIGDECLHHGNSRGSSWGVWGQWGVFKLSSASVDHELAMWTHLISFFFKYEN